MKYTIHYFTRPVDESTPGSFSVTQHLEIPNLVDFIEEFKEFFVLNSDLDNPEDYILDASRYVHPQEGYNHPAELEITIIQAGDAGMVIYPTTPPYNPATDNPPIQAYFEMFLDTLGGIRLMTVKAFESSLDSFIRNFNNDREAYITALEMYNSWGKNEN